VWSWHPDADAKLPGDDPSGDGGQKPVHRGDHDINVKTVARGMPDDRLNLWYLPPAFFSAGGPWVRPSPGIPRALSLFERAQLSQSSGVIRRENELSWALQCET
jgi:hypothetical protein